MSATENGLSAKQKLLTGEELLQELFTEGSRKSLSWLRDQRMARNIPFVRIGGSISYVLEDVRAAIRDRHTVKRKGA